MNQYLRKNTCINMKINLLCRFLFLFALIIACNKGYSFSNTNQQVYPENVRYSDSIKINDTIFVYEWLHDTTVYSSDSVYSIGAKKYQITCKANSLNDTIYKTINHIDSVETENIHVWIEKSSNNMYCFTVKESGKIVFSTSVTKKDFQDINDQDITMSFPISPTYVGCDKSESFFLFKIEFALLGTDIGGDYFLVFGKDGKLILKGFNSNFWGGHNKLVITPDKRHFVSGSGISDFLKMTVPFPNEATWTSVVNDSIVFVFYELYEYKDTMIIQMSNYGVEDTLKSIEAVQDTISDNVYMYSVNGTLINKFKVIGFCPRMGDGEPIFMFDEKLNSILVFDLERDLLFLINKNKLSEVKVIPLSIIPKVESPIDKEEEIYKVNIECMSTYVLYFKKGVLVKYFKKVFEY
ncbi:MAG: hypothetical protein WCP69_13950 [Bacteroidota bacterium]